MVAREEEEAAVEDRFLVNAVLTMLRGVQQGSLTTEVALESDISREQVCSWVSLLLQSKERFCVQGGNRVVFMVMRIWLFLCDRFAIDRCIAPREAHVHYFLLLFSPSTFLACGYRL